MNQEGNPDGFFDNGWVQDKVAMDNDWNFLLEIDLQVFIASNQDEDIALVHNQGNDVDDDNEPSPENIPDTSTPLTLDNEGLFDGQNWGVGHHVDPMELHGSKKPPSCKEFDPSQSVSLLIFLKLFP